MIDLFELRIVALVGVIAVMIGTASLVRVGVAVAERLRPRRGADARSPGPEGSRRAGSMLTHDFDAGNTDEDSPRGGRIQKIRTAIRTIGGEIP